MAGQIAQLGTFSRQQLLDMWRKLYERAAPRGIRRELLIPFLAYRIQEHAYGGLKSSARSELRRIARDLEKSSGSTRLILRPKIKAGTRLLREWRGQTRRCRVAVLTVFVGDELRYSFGNGFTCAESRDCG
jgi:DUF2924 family protein